LEADALMMTGPREASSGADATLEHALDMARIQSARSIELLVARDLAELWRDHGKRAEAHNLLAPVYGWFTEGLDTPDLRDAKALLDELG
jgi:predicted ATPase